MIDDFALTVLSSSIEFAGFVTAIIIGIAAVLANARSDYRYLGSDRQKVLMWLVIGLLVILVVNSILGILAVYWLFDHATNSNLDRTIQTIKLGVCFLLIVMPVLACIAFWALKK